MSDTDPNTSDFFRKLAEYASDVITITDSDGRMIFNNPAVETTFGYSPASIQGDNVASYIHPDDVEHVNAAIQSVVSGEVDCAEAEFRFRHINKTYRHVHAVGRLWTHDNMRGLLVNSRDVTQQHAIINSLARTNELLSKTFDASSVYLTITNYETGEFIEVNDAWCRAMGYSREEAIGNSAIDLGIWGSPQNRQKFLDALSENDNFSGYETHIFSRSGDARLVVMDARLISVSKAPQLLISCQDITEARRIEEELRQSQKMEAIGQLTGGVAHDFNNLIGITMGNAELLLRQLPPDSTHRQYAQQILDASLRAADLTRQLLAFSRRQPLQPEPIDTLEQLNMMLPLLRTTLSENTEISIQAEPGLGLCSIDKGLFESAILNLALNARDAMATGGQVSFSLTNIGRDNNYFVQLTVTDNGAGMSAATRERAFEPFFTTKDQGTGLGLAMVFGFVKQSSGHIQLESTEGSGTSVVMQFPQVRAPIHPAPDPASTQVEYTNPDRPRVLIVEDNAPLRVLVAEYLASMGYRVLEASSEASALRALEDVNDLHLLVSDILLEGPVTGVQVAEKLRARYPGLQVALITGYADQAPTEVADALLQKPFSRDRFIQVIGALTGQAPPLSEG